MNKVALVIGAGDAAGGAIAGRFARAGVTRRDAGKLAELEAAIQSEGGTCHAFGADARDEDAVLKLFADIETGIGPIEVCVFNVGGNVRVGILDPDAIADASFTLYCQPRTAWTHELDLRPWDREVVTHRTRQPATSARQA